MGQASPSPQPPPPAPSPEAEKKGQGRAVIVANRGEIFYNQDGGGSLNLVGGQKRVVEFKNAIQLDNWVISVDQKDNIVFSYCEGPKKCIPRQTISAPRKFPPKIGLIGGKHGKYCADEDGRISCNRNNREGWEVFTVENIGIHKIALKGGRAGQYCADDGDGMKCNRNSIGGWEQFRFEPLEGNKMALIGGRSGKYCADEGDKIICNRDSIGGWETFRVDTP